MKPTLTQLLRFAGPAVALGVVAVSWLLSDPLTIRRAFLADVAVIAFAAGVILVVMPSVVGTTWAIALPWLACGALLVAAVLGPITLAPWVALASLAVSLSGTLLGAPVQPRVLVRLGLVGGGAVVNGAVLWILLLGGHRPLPPAEFEAQPLRVHTLLADVPLHDVWAVQLRGGGADWTMEDVQTLLKDGLARPPNAVLAGLAAVRVLLGLVFSLDDQECTDPAASYMHRLSEEDRARSLREPVANGFLYTFEREALVELVNCTVHAFIAMALEPAADGQRLAVGIYVKQNRKITPYYMALIDPFRRLIVYLAVIEHMERHWARVMRASHSGP